MIDDPVQNVPETPAESGAQALARAGRPADAAPKGRHGRAARWLGERPARQLRVGPHSAFVTAAGPRHAANEDRVLVPDEVPLALVLEHGWLYAVADGVSRSEGGAIASQLAIETLVEAFYRPLAATVLPETTEQRLIAAVAAAQGAVRRTAQSVGAMGLACTLVAFVLWERSGWLVSVGDSRAYRVRGGRAEQLTRDHTVAGELLAREAIDSATAATHPGRKMLARAIGAEDATPDVVRIRGLRPDERLVLTTDGVTDVLTDREMGRWVSGFPPRSAAAALLDAVRQRGMVDDATALVVAPAGHLGAAVTALARRFSVQRTGVALGVAAGIVLVGSVAWWAALDPAGSQLASAEVSLGPARAVEPQDLASAATAPPTIRRPEAPATIVRATAVAGTASGAAATARLRPTSASAPSTPASEGGFQQTETADGTSDLSAACSASDIDRNGVVDARDVRYISAAFRAVETNRARDGASAPAMRRFDPDGDGALTLLDTVLVSSHVGCAPRSITAGSTP